MDRRTKIIVSVAGVFIVLLALIGITYAYFLTRVEGNTNDKSISVTTANLKLVYSDGTTNLLVRENIMPDTIVATKDFTVKNEGTAQIDEYQIYLENVINDFTEEGMKDVKLRITCKSNKTGNTCYGYDSTYPKTNAKLISNRIEIGEIHSYELEVEYVETNTDQSADMGKTLEGKIQIYDPRDVIAISGVVDITNPLENAAYYVELHSEVKTSQIQSDGTYVIYGVKPEEHTLYVKAKTNSEVSDIGNTSISIIKGSVANITSDASNIVINNETEKSIINIDVSEDNKFIEVYGVDMINNPYSEGSLSYEIINNAILSNNSSVNSLYIRDILSSVSNVISTEDERILSESRDDFTDNTGINSYYFRGNVIDNYVNFAGMCWKIVRIQGDGSIKLILEDGYSNCNSENYSGNWSMPNDIFSVGNYGYTRYESNQLVGNNKNTSNKDLMDYLEPKTNADVSMIKALYDFQNVLETKISSIYSNADLNILLKSGDWCIGNKKYFRQPLSENYSFSIITDNEFIDHINTTNSFFYNENDWVYYDAYVRLGNDNTDGNTPSLICNGDVISDFENVSSNDVTITSKKPMYVGTITADELVYAGGKVYEGNEKFYLINSAFHDAKFDIDYFWTLSPYFNDGSEDYVINIDNSGFIDNDGGVTWKEVGIRPMIILKNDVKYDGGNGTQSNPYVISY